MGRKRQHPELDELIGTDSDSALANKFGLTRSAVQQRRIQLGKKPSQKHTPHKPWTEAELTLLGSMTDSAVAKKIDRSRGAVTAKRLEIGLPAFTQNKSHHGKATFPDKFVSLLGTDIDRVIAKKTGYSAKTIHQKRIEKGIPAFRANKWTTENISLLGTDIDRVIAKKIGLSKISINKKRNELGIPKFIKTPRATPSKSAFSDVWPRIKQLPQGDLFAALQKLHDPSKPKLTHKHLAELTGYSLSRMQKWMTPGSAQEPLSLSTRHHIYLAIANNHHI